jgi:hypothetical protein
MRPRRSLAAAVVLLAWSAGSPPYAQARVTPCHVIADATADAPPQPPPARLVSANDDSLDITSADIASDSNTITAVIRLRKYETIDPLDPLGRMLYFQFASWPSPTYPVKPMFLLLVDTPADVPHGYWGLVTSSGGGAAGATTNGPAHVTIDTAHAEVHISWSLETYPRIQSVIKPGALLGSFLVESLQFTGDPTSNVTPLGMFGGALVDTTTSTRLYRSGGPSCVRPGV